MKSLETDGRRCRIPFGEIVLVLGIAILIGGGCKLPIDQANEKAGIAPPKIGKNLRGNRERNGFGTGIDERARDIESNLGFR